MEIAKRKVAIVGGHPSRREAPFAHKEWDIWAFASLRVHTPRVSRWFEMHALQDLKEQLRTPTRARRSFLEYMRYLRRLPCPVFMQRTHTWLPRSVRYPLRDALSGFGRCFSGTAAYMIALAIMERYETIGLWGIRLDTGHAYVRQRSAVEYLLGVARQRGIDVYLPPGCSLDIPDRPVRPKIDVLYGYEWRSAHAWWRKQTPRGVPQSKRWLSLG